MKRYSLFDVFKDALKYIWIIILVAESFQLGIIASIVSYDDLPKFAPEVFANQEYYINKVSLLFLIGLLGVLGVYNYLYSLVKRLFKK